MFRFPRLTRVVASVVVVLGVLVLSYPVWSGESYSELGDLWGNSQMRSQNRYRELQAKQDEVNRRLEHRQAILENVLARQMTLWEAADHFLALNQSDHTCVDNMRYMFPGLNDRECAARQVIAHLKVSHLTGGPEMATELAREIPGLTLDKQVTLREPVR